MTQAELKTILSSTGLPVVYSHWKSTPPSTPYIAYKFMDSDNFSADDKVYSKAKNYNIELYTVKKDLASEKLIEDAFDNNNIYYENSEVYIDTERLYQVVYEVSI